MTRAVVFAYHNVGRRCLAALLGAGVEVPLVVTHEDNPGERIWFASVAALAAEHDLPAITPADPNVQDVVARVEALEPDFLFSFYYRQMLGERLLAAPGRGALNMHGSLLPRYRGRVPVNWAVINGESETGATLHYMVAKPDAGDIVDRQAVPIQPDDTAGEVFDKVTVAAEMVLHRSLPGLIAATAPRIPQDLSAGSYFGGRRPEDGRIDWSAPARRVHDLVRGVAPPYPGAYTELGGGRLRVLRTARMEGRRGPHPRPALFAESGRCYAQCGDGALLRLLDLEFAGRKIPPADLPALLGAGVIALGG
ncbi:MAG TPA: formyltransferase [Burkholderiales bacterium]